MPESDSSYRPSINFVAAVLILEKEPVERRGMCSARRERETRNSTVSNADTALHFMP